MRKLLFSLLVFVYFPQLDASENLTTQPSNPFTEPTTSTRELFPPLSLEQKLEDFQFLAAYFRNMYGPVERKGQTRAVVLDDLIAETRVEIQNDKSNDDESFYKILNRFTAAFKDAHTTFNRPDYRGSTLGLSLRRVVEKNAEGKEVEKAIISKINRTMLPEKDFSIFVGDEVISIGGQKISEIADELLKVLNWSAPKSARDFVYRRITERVGTRFDTDHLMAQNEIEVLVKSRGEIEHRFAMRWQKTGFYIAREMARTGLLDEVKAGVDMTPATTTTSNSAKKTRGLIDLPSFYSRIKNCRAIQAEDLPGWKKAEDFIEIEEQIFSARPVFNRELGICNIDLADKNKTLKLGYVRIDTFLPRESTAYGEYASEIYANLYKRIFTYLQIEADAVLIDIRGNNGGSIDYMGRMLSFLSKDPIDTGTQEFPINRFYFDWLSREYQKMVSGSVNPKNTTDKKAYENTLRNFIQQKNAGKTYLKDAELYGSRFILPLDEQGYTSFQKPIFVLMDSGSASCGEWFPAALKANGRAILLGSTTLGAGGGDMLLSSLPNSLGKLRITQPLWKMKDGSYIEDNGVDADISVTMSQKDYREGYEVVGGYRDQILDAIKKTYSEKL